jgi:hypothetical protein
MQKKKQYAHHVRIVPFGSALARGVLAVQKSVPRSIKNHSGFSYNSDESIRRIRNGFSN